MLPHPGTSQPEPFRVMLTAAGKWSRVGESVRQAPPNQSHEGEQSLRISM